MILLMNCNFPFRYKPHVWEFSRLNITHFVMSKRKLNLLCTSGDPLALCRRCSNILVHLFYSFLYCRHCHRLGRSPHADSQRSAA